MFINISEHVKDYYLHNIPMKGKITFFGAKRKIRLWKASSDDVWKLWLSFSISLRTLLLYNSFSTLWSAIDPVAKQIKYEENLKILLFYCHSIVICLSIQSYLVGTIFLDPWKLCLGVHTWGRGGSHEHVHFVCGSAVNSTSPPFLAQTQRKSHSSKHGFWCCATIFSAPRSPSFLKVCQVS